METPKANPEEDNGNKANQLYFVKFKPRQDRVVESKINEAENLYKELKGECRKLKKLIDFKKNWNWELSYLKQKEMSVLDDLAWKNDKLILELKALKRRSLGKHAQRKILQRRDNNNNLQSLMRHQIGDLTSEKKILKERSDSGCERLGNNGAILALMEPGDITRTYKLIKAEFWQESKAIMESRQKLLVNTEKLSHDEKQIKLLMQDTVRLMCIIMEVKRRSLMAIKEKIKIVEEKHEIEITSLQNKLADLELRKDEVRLYAHKLQKKLDKKNASYNRHVFIMNEARRLTEKNDVEALHELSQKEVEYFMLNWNINKGFRDDYRKMISAIPR
ncbi:hypothetical protein ACFE04_017220 [Oxalis oulophora]